MTRSPMVGIRRRRGKTTTKIYSKHTFQNVQYYPRDWGSQSIKLLTFSEKAILDLNSKEGPTNLKYFKCSIEDYVRTCQPNMERLYVYFDTLSSTLARREGECIYFDKLIEFAKAPNHYAAKEKIKEAEKILTNSLEYWEYCKKRFPGYKELFFTDLARLTHLEEVSSNVESSLNSTGEKIDDLRRLSIYNRSLSILNY
jgi:hypothetical protein